MVPQLNHLKGLAMTQQRFNALAIFNSNNLVDKLPLVDRTKKYFWNLHRRGSEVMMIEHCHVRV